MGSCQTEVCCFTPHKEIELFAEWPYGDSHQYSDWLLRKEILSKLNTLGTINYNLCNLKSIQGDNFKYLQQNEVSVETFIDNLLRPLQVRVIDVLASKVMLKQRHNIIENTNSTYQHCLLAPNQFIRTPQVFQSIEGFEIGYLQQQRVSLAVYAHSIKLNQLRLKRSIDDDNQADYNIAMINDLLNIDGMKDYAWNIENKQTFLSMRNHVLYNWARIIPIVNKQMSINEELSLQRVKLFYHFMLKVMREQSASRQAEYICDKYTLQMQVTMPQSYQYLQGELLFFTNYAKLTTTSQTPSSKQGKGMTIQFILTKTDQLKYGLLYEGNIFLSPFCVFEIVKICSNAALKTKKIWLQEYPQQPLIEQTEKLKVSIMMNSYDHVNINKDNLLTELDSLKEKVVLQVEELIEKMNMGIQSTKTIPNKYKKDDESHISRVTISSQINEYYLEYQAALQVKINKEKEQDLLKRSEILMKSMKTIHFQSPNKLQEQSASQDGPVSVSDAERENSIQLLTEYVEQHNLHKLQIQLIKSFDFTMMTTLNLSASHLTRIECIQYFPNLKQLFLYSNQITKIEGLDTNYQLRLLSLAHNQIEKLENIDHLAKLKQLYVGKNKLTKNSVSYFASHPWRYLETLSISFNGDDISRNDKSIQSLQRIRWKRLKYLIIGSASLLTAQCRNKLTMNQFKYKVELLL